MADYELAEHETAILVQAVHVADLCTELQALVDEFGLMKDGRANPALVELRMQRILLARLIVALRVPLGDEDNARTQYRGPRGVYAMRGQS